MAYIPLQHITTGRYPRSRCHETDEKHALDDRKSGAFALLNKWHEEKGLEFWPSGIYRPRDSRISKQEYSQARFKRLIMRVVPIYVPLIKALGATGVNTAGGEVFTALERGTVHGFWWGAVRSDLGVGTKSVNISGALLLDRGCVY